MGMAERAVQRAQHDLSRCRAPVLSTASHVVDRRELIEIGRPLRRSAISLPDFNPTSVVSSPDSRCATAEHEPTAMAAFDTLPSPPSTTRAAAMAIEMTR